jgi:hypothetical protein
LELIIMRIEPCVVFVGAYLLLAWPGFAKEAPTQVVTPPASPAAGTKQESFEGIIVDFDKVQERPEKGKPPPKDSRLQVKSLEGDVRSFVVAPEQLSASKIAMGDLVRVTYEAGPTESRLGEIKVLGRTLTGTVKEIAADMSSLVIRTQQPDTPKNEVNVPLQMSNQFQPLVTAMRPGDGIRATYERRENGINSVRALEWQSESVGRGKRWLSLLLAAFGLWLVALIFTKGHPTTLFLGIDKRYSTSKFQTVLWFWIVISAYCAILYYRIAAAGWSYIGGVDIPLNLLVLSGISVLTFAAAKAITVGKVEQAAAKGEDAKPAAVTPKAGDLIQDDLRRTDLGDFQMVTITVLAVVIYAVSTVEFMQNIEFRRVITMPDVDATLLAIFGLGQAAYLGKKAAGDAGAGMTSEQAVKAAADAAAAAKDEAAKAGTAEQTAKSKENEARAAAGAVAAAANKAAAQPEADKAEATAKAAREAANSAATSAKAAEVRASEVRKLAETWSKEPSASTAIKNSFTAVQAETAKAKTSAANAEAAAQNAEKLAENAKVQASQKP